MYFKSPNLITWLSLIVRISKYSKPAIYSGPPTVNSLSGLTLWRLKMVWGNPYRGVVYRNFFYLKLLLFWIEYQPVVAYKRVAYEKKHVIFYSFLNKEMDMFIKSRLVMLHLKKVWRVFFIITSNMICL